MGNEKTWADIKRTVEPVASDLIEQYDEIMRIQRRRMGPLRNELARLELACYLSVVAIKNGSVEHELRAGSESATVYVSSSGLVPATGEEPDYYELDIAVVVHPASSDEAA